MTEKIVPLGRNDAGLAAELLARAFADDPLFRFAERDGRRRAAAISIDLALTLRWALIEGVVHTTAEEIAGAALWQRPLPGPETVSEAELEEMHRLRAAAWGQEAWLRMSEVFAAVNHRRDADAPFDHWHLLVLAVDQGRRRRGTGGRLLAPVLALADAEGLPCYVETFNPANLAFYERQGFAPLREIPLDGGLHCWTMLRRPDAPAVPAPFR